MPSGCSRAEWACPNGQAHSAREYLGGRSSLSQVNKSSWNLPCLRVVTWIWGWWNQPSSCRGSGHPSATAIWLRPVTTFWLRGRCTPLSGSQVVSLSPPVDAIYPPPPLLLRFRRQPVGWRVILHVANRQMPSGCSRAEWACPNGQAHSAREYLGGRSSLSQVNKSSWNLPCLRVVTWTTTGQRGKLYEKNILYLWFSNFTSTETHRC